SAIIVPFGLIVDGGLEGSVSTVVPCAGGHAGKFSVKLSASPGTVNLGTRLVITADGSCKADDGTAGNIQVAEAMETGTAGELVEAVLIRPVTVGPETIDDGSVTANKLASNAVTTAKINDSSVTAAKLADAVADKIASTTVAVANTGTPDGVAHVTGQVQDAQGNSLAGRFIITLWLATSGAWAAPADLGTLTAKTNSLLLKEDTDDAFARILTHSDGSWGADLDTVTDGTIHAHAVVSGLAVTANAAITGN
ncbi:hypothetical protein, partial [Prosthecobacter sp.]|uniref:hypothetical protein n=1 Tax=Prosthecobacter sp. TaxID=1965333 RepID=UPI0037834587